MLKQNISAFLEQDVSFWKHRDKKKTEGILSFFGTNSSFLCTSHTSLLPWVLTWGWFQPL